MNESGGAVESTDEGDNVEKSEEDLQVVKTTKLEDLIRNKTEYQVSSDADELFIEKVNFLAEVLASEAVEIAEQRDGKTVGSREIEDSYQNLLKPHNELFKALQKVQKAKEGIEEVAHSSPMSKRQQNDR